MELIKPSVEIWEQNNSIDGIWAHIDRCTRVCYQSTSKENNETKEEFVKRVILKNGTEENFEKLHGAMLEHGTVYLKCYDYKCNGRNPMIKYARNKYSKTHYNHDSSCWYVTTNLRVIYENNWLNDLEHICSPTEHHDKRVTVCFITNIGVSREFNRHRVNSIAEESTRYCNYSKKNDGQLKIALPSWLLQHDEYLERHKFDSISEYADEILANDDNDLLEAWCDIDFYLSALTFAQWHYNMLIKKGWTPQQAREVLPLATKTQLIHTAFIDDWKHFIRLRGEGISGAPHPNARILATSLKQELIKRNYIEDKTV